MAKVKVNWDEQFSRDAVPFRALKSFPCEELRSEYEEGLTYTWRPGYKILQVMLPLWYDNGLIELLENEQPTATKVSGQGTVR